MLNPRRGSRQRRAKDRLTSTGTGGALRSHLRRRSSPTRSHAITMKAQSLGGNRGTTRRSAGRWWRVALDGVPALPDCRPVGFGGDHPGSWFGGHHTDLGRRPRVSSQRRLNSTAVFCSCPASDDDQDVGMPSPRSRFRFCGLRRLHGFQRPPAHEGRLYRPKGGLTLEGRMPFARLPSKKIPLFESVHLRLAALRSAIGLRGVYVRCVLSIR